MQLLLQNVHEFVLGFYQLAHFWTRPERLKPAQAFQIIIMMDSRGENHWQMDPFPPDFREMWRR